MLRRSDLWIALAGGALGAAAGLPWPPGWDPGILVAGLLGALLGLARPFPTVTWVAASGLVFAAGATGTLPGGEDTVAAYLLVAAHAFAAGRFETRRRGYVAVAVMVVAAYGGAVLAGEPGEAVFLFIPPASWGAGRALRERSVMADELALRARELEAEREAFAALSVRYERARIASELHDIVAHAISVMVVQASAGQRLVGRDDDAAAEAFSAIADAARQAEHEMGLLVDLLADETGAAPDLAVVEDLVARAAGSGLDVRLALDGVRDGFPVPVTQVAYRVVQEGLTNALRHAAGAPVEVRLDGSDGDLVVEVVNGPGPARDALAGPGSGRGLGGLRERAEAIGGTLRAGPTDAGGWRVTARLPAAAGVARA